MLAEELEFELPESLIAQAPLAERSASRLLVVDRKQGHAHHAVRELPGLLPPSLFIVNETRVIPARLHGHKASGGKCELLLVEPIEGPTESKPRWRCLGTANKPLKAGTDLVFAVDGRDPVRARIEARHAGGLLEVRFAVSPEAFDAFLQASGEMPLPPYIRRAADNADDERYQTVFAKVPGAVAAPTAGLHFDAALLDAMTEAGHHIARVTLHVGPGTFRPVQTEDLDDHPMHTERYEVPAATAAAIAEARREGQPVVAIGTTVVRTLEAAATGDGLVQVGSGQTKLFIQPGYTPKVVDHLFTNFHLPRSTLLALVMAFGGKDTIRSAYAAAVSESYRFFSYGDAMLIRSDRTNDLDVQ